MRRIFSLLWIVVLLAGCAPPEPGPDDAPALARYVHPSGAFSLDVPRSWLVGDLSDGPALLVTFTPPDADHAALTVFAVRLAEPLADTDAFQAAMADYLAADYNAGVDVVEQAAMGDGSWRVTAVRHSGGESLPVNIFMQRDGAYFSALEVVMPYNDPVGWALRSRMVNAYAVDAAVELAPGAVDALPLFGPDFILAGGNVGFSGLLTWTDDAGRLRISGRVANRAPYPLHNARIYAAVMDGIGAVVAEAAADLPLPVLLDGEYAPFTLAFDSAQPSGAVRYTLRVEADSAGAALLAFYGPQYFDWEDRAEYDADGLLHVRGTAWNAGDRAAHDVQILVTLFDAADRVAGYERITAAEALAPGDSARFDVPVTAVGAEPARYLVAVFGGSRP